MNYDWKTCNCGLLRIVVGEMQAQCENGARGNLEGSAHCYEIVPMPKEEWVKKFESKEVGSDKPVDVSQRKDIGFYAHCAKCNKPTTDLGLLPKTGPYREYIVRCHGEMDRVRKNDAFVTEREYPDLFLGVAFEFSKVEVVSEVKEGTDEGEVCNRDGCLGIIERDEHFSGGCSCHTGNPPCSFCVDAKLHCPLCDWNEVE